jgi:ribonuclease P protein component
MSRDARGATTLSLSRSERLRLARDFTRVFKAGDWGVSTSVRVVVCRRSADSLGRRVGVAVSKAFGNAVRRNLIKRRMREAFRHVKASLPEGVDVVILPSRRSPNPSYQELRAALPGLIRKTLERHDRRRRKGRRRGD